MARKFDPKAVAEKFKQECTRLGWTWAARDTTVSIRKTFPAGDNAGFVECDSEYYYLLLLIPQTKPGSVWGTDGRGSGAFEALHSGVFTENKSGCSKQVVAALNQR